MTNYVLVYSGGGMPETQAEQNAVMAAWGTWYEGSVSQGAPSALSGYTVITADSLDAATERARSCPILASGGRVDVYETFQIM
jgi:hypothetical protein